MGYLLQNGGLGMAGDWIITGGRPLQGRVEVPAAKNSVLPLLAASLLCSGPVRLQNVPRLTDVEDCLALLQGIEPDDSGCTIVNDSLVSRAVEMAMRWRQQQ